MHHKGSLLIPKDVAETRLLLRSWPGDFTVCKGFDSATFFAGYFPFSHQTNRD